MIRAWWYDWTTHTGVGHVRSPATSWSRLSPATSPYRPMTAAASGAPPLRAAARQVTPAAPTVSAPRPR